MRPFLLGSFILVKTFPEERFDYFFKKKKKGKGRERMSCKENFSLFIFDFPPSKNMPAIFPSRLHVYVFISCSKNLSFFFLFVFTVSKKFFIIFKRLASLCCRRGEKNPVFSVFLLKGVKSHLKM